MRNLNNVSIDGDRRAATGSAAKASSADRSRAWCGITPTISTIRRAAPSSRCSRNRAASIWGGDYKYYRATLEDRNYTTIAKNTVLATRLKFGLADSLGPSDDYPLFLRFFPGGEGSVRGYGRWRLGTAQRIQ